MKLTTKLLLMTCLLTFSIGHAQELTQKQKEREEVKVKLFTIEEFSNLQVWFEEQVKEMNLTEDEDATYRSILNLYLGKMARLDDKDSGLSKEEMIKEMRILILKLNGGVEPFLFEVQYKKHLNIMEVFEKIVTEKLLKE